MKLIISLLFFFSASTFAISFDSYKTSSKKKIHFDISLKKINESIIINPTVMKSTLQIGKTKIDFSTLDLFYKPSRAGQKVFGQTGNYFLHLNAQKLKGAFHHVVIRLRNIKSQKTQVFQGIFKLNTKKSGKTLKSLASI